MTNKDLIKTISDMIKEVKTITSDEFTKYEKIDISYEEGVKYFGSMMERLLNSIEKIESSFERMKEQN